MLKVELKKLQANLEYYYQKLEEGEKIQVLENGKPIYELTEPFGPREPLPPTEIIRVKRGKRVLGQHKELLKIPDSFFFDALPQHDLDLFEKAPLVSTTKRKR